MELSLVIQLVTLGGVIVSIFVFVISSGWNIKECITKLQDKVDNLESKVDRMLNNHLPHIEQEIKDLNLKASELDKKLYAHLKQHE